MARTLPTPSRATVDRPGRHLGTILVATALLTASTSVVFPLLAELQAAYGLPTWSLGLLSAAAFLAGLAAQLLLAPLADHGHARLLLVGGLALAAISGVLFGLGSSLPQLLVARLVAGVSTGAFLPAARALASTVDSARAGRNLGRLAAAELGGFVMGPVAGSVLFELWGLRAPFFVFAALAAGGLVLMAGRRLPQPSAAVESSAPSLTLLRYRGVTEAALLALALFLPVGIYDSLWARYLADRGAGAVFVGVTLAMYGVPFVALASTGGRVADRYGPLPCAYLCLLLLAPLTFLYGAVASLGLIVVVLLVEAVVQAVAVPATQSAMARACPPGRIAAGQGLAGAMQQLGAALVALAAAPVYGAAGSAVVFGGAAVLLLAISAAAWWVGRPRAAVNLLA